MSKPGFFGDEASSFINGKIFLTGPFFTLSTGWKAKPMPRGFFQEKKQLGLFGINQQIPMLEWVDGFGIGPSHHQDDFRKIFGGEGIPIYKPWPRQPQRIGVLFADFCLGTQGLSNSCFFLKK